MSSPQQAAGWLTVSSQRHLCNLRRRLRSTPLAAATHHPGTRGCSPRRCSAAAPSCSRLGPPGGEGRSRPGGRQHGEGCVGCWGRVTPPLAAGQQLRTAAPRQPRRTSILPCVRTSSMGRTMAQIILNTAAERGRREGVLSEETLCRSLVSRWAGLEAAAGRQSRQLAPALIQAVQQAAHRWAR